ncbi:DUF3016 domain-containing protein [Alteromonas sp. C1M14]|uniref:DUF3016 domain-containing protein n=1 Tax=Alteromonas sp. C1M14 TaxID=2841567 RepID=UPI001C0801FC|nr:DUF3016 domain-containing protein [Alteromonas sp. C1M14]MBU2977601.1 DUF3016 domain-containing protein [Alteromonas sp. C1M14]
MVKLVKNSALCFFVAALAVSANAYSATAEVTWQAPDDYTDVRAANENRARFKERTFKTLDEYFAKLAEKLPEEQTLVITVTDLDLAGQVWPSSFVFGNGMGSDVRIIKRVDIPRIVFSYTLKDGAGNEIKSANVNLKDMGFLENSRLVAQSDNLAYEKAMIKDWFRDEMADVTVKNL